MCIRVMTYDHVPEKKKEIHHKKWHKKVFIVFFLVFV